MLRIREMSNILGCGLALAVLVAPERPWAEDYKQLYAFQVGTDGAYPVAGLLADKGNLYGTTRNGGNSRCTYGCGTVFELTKSRGKWSEIQLYAFRGISKSDGYEPGGMLIRDELGNLYGTTTFGGQSGCSGVGCGTLFKLAPDGTETVLYAFRGGTDGALPTAGLIADKSSNFYGTTVHGGDTDCGISIGCGTVFKLGPHRTELVLHVFAGGNDGALPSGALIRDQKGNLYGTTTEGGSTVCNNGYGCGTVFKIAPNGTETVLYSFCSRSYCTDGASPNAPLIRDKTGNFYGTTTLGGTSSKCEPVGTTGCGTVFKLAPDGTETVLHSFAGHHHGDGKLPGAAVIVDKKGNFYGTTTDGGTNGNGTVFEVAPDHKETVLYSFTVGTDGTHPYAALIQDRTGKLYGVSAYGGDESCGDHDEGCGTVFTVKK